jgi:Tol biopolymer transport system component
MSYPDGTVTPLTNDLSNYRGVDVDAQRRAVVTVRREVRVSVAAGGATDAQLAEVVRPVQFGAQPTSLVWAGERLLYDSQVNGLPAVAAIPIDGGTPQHLIADAYSVAATSDGRTIVFMRDGADGLWRADGDGGGVSQIVGGDASDPLVLPDDRTVMFVRERSESLWTVPIDGGEADARQVVTGIVGSQGFDVSRDGRRLVFRLAGEPPATVVCDLPACTNRSTLPSNPTAGFRWTPDGEHIAYADQGSGGIWSVSLDGGEPRREHTGATPPNRIIAFAWSRDGTRVAVIQGEVSNDIVLLNLRE